MSEAYVLADVDGLSAAVAAAIEGAPNRVASLYSSGYTAQQTIAENIGPTVISVTPDTGSIDGGDVVTVVAKFKGTLGLGGALTIGPNVTTAFALTQIDDDTWQWQGTTAATDAGTYDVRINQSGRIGLYTDAFTFA